MPRSPTSSEDETAQSVSDYSDDGVSDSSCEDTVYETIQATPTRSRMDDVHVHSLVIRVLIPDLQQTVKTTVLSVGNPQDEATVHLSLRCPFRW